MKKQKICVVGAGVAGMFAVTKLINNNYPGELITVIDAGIDPHHRTTEEVMDEGFGAGLFSVGKW